MRYAAVIPVLNAGPALGQLLDALEKQTVLPETVVIPDSESDDGAVPAAAERARVRVIRIPRKEFDHGGTRDLALRTCGTPFVVMMTQDALPVNEKCMEELLHPFEDPRVAAVCGRQIARPEARPAEKEVRAFRYGNESDVWDWTDAERRGIGAYLLSDVCAAYRVSAYGEVGGFTHPIGTNEDMLIAADFLQAGYKLAYRAEAAVFHSHDYTLRQEYERNKKIGQFLAEYGERFSGGVAGEGFRMVKTVTTSLLRQGRIGEVIRFGLDCAARAAGNRRGRKTGRRAEG